MKIKFERFSNDLFAEFECKCPSKKWADSTIAHLMKTKIKLSGYADDYFFNVVNKEPRVVKCECGRSYKYQWFTNGVQVEEILW